MEYGVLFSHASEDTVPGLVVTGFPSRTKATSHAASICRASGVRALILWRATGDDPWAATNGLGAPDALRDGIERGWRGWI